jgi:hypothetical protein
MSGLRKRLHGANVGCMMCGEREAKWVVLNFFYCDECVEKVDK